MANILVSLGQKLVGSKKHYTYHWGDILKKQRLEAQAAATKAMEETLPIEATVAPASAAPAALPLETADIPTASYLEMVEDQAIKQQKALAYQVKGSGIVSDQQAQELAMSAPEKRTDLTWVFVIALVGVLATKLGSKLWK